MFRVELESGLVFEVSADGPIERALLLRREARPDHVWEPQTTRLLLALARETLHVVIGGAYIGDHVVPIAGALRSRPGARVHAFEPMDRAFRRLVRHMELNRLDNVFAHRAALCDVPQARFVVEGPPALARCRPLGGAAEDDPTSEVVDGISIDEYARREGIEGVGLVMLDLEGGEDAALRGARGVLAAQAPHVIFEVHSSYVDWSRGLENAAPVAAMLALGYQAFAIRDFHDNHRMAGRPIEVVPIDRVVTAGPPHGFNVLATKDAALVERLALRVVRDVSPKLLAHKDPALHHPLDGPP